MRQRELRSQLIAPKARTAEGFHLPITHGLPQALEREIGQAVGGDVASDLLHRVTRCDKLLSGRSINSVEAGPARRWAGNPQVDLRGTCCFDHLDDLPRGRTPHNRVIHYHYPLTLQDFPHSGELQLHPKVANGLLGLDESTAHIVAANQSHVVRYTADLRVADRSRDPGIRNGDD